ncbi:MAG: TAXI family TRAP transporter solute-binding subunit [Candidatus Aminicenantes bacterium]|jgi:TRAP transporter TAXI family solute receptor
MISQKKGWLIQGVLCCLVLFLVTFILLSASRAYDKKLQLVLATATTGGTYYPVGVAIATITTNNLDPSDNISMTAITSAGSGENIQLLKNKEADLAIIQGLYGAMAWQGRGRYEGKPQHYIRSLAVLWENVEHFVILEKYVNRGDMSDLQNIINKNFSIGKRGSGTETSGRVILEALGYNPSKDFKLKYLGYNPSAGALQNGRIAGMNIPAGPPASAITQACAVLGPGGMRILDFTERQLEAVNSEYAVWKRAILEPGTYPGQDKPVRTISQSNLLIVHEDVGEDPVYKIVKNTYDNLPFLGQVHRATEKMSVEGALEGLSVPLHPGALRYYREQGLSIPSHLLLK